MTLSRFCFIVILALTGWGGSATAQIDFCETPSSKGSFDINADSNFYQLIASTIEANRSNRKIQGYRIQIYFGGNRREASKVKARFLNKYPEKSAYTIYQQPNFKIRVGNFRNKLEAQKLYHELSKRFNTVFIVPTRIKYPALPEPN